MEALYNQYRRLMLQQAWHYARKYDMPIEEMESEAHLIFVEAVQSFEPERASFCTHLYHQLRKLGRFARRERAVVYGDFSGTGETAEQQGQGSIGAVADGCVDTAYGLTEWMIDSRHLSEDAQVVLQHLLAGDFHPAEDAKRARLPNQSRAAVVMRSLEQWPKQRTIDAWHEVRCWYLSGAFEHATA